MFAGRDLYLADFYAQELCELGSAGFTAWLTESFSGPIAAPRAPHFHTEELETEAFGIVFSRAVPYFSEEASRIARAGVAGLGASLEIQRYEGMLSFARLMEALGLTDSLSALHRQIRKKLGAESAALQLPDTEFEAFSLRETLECFFRGTLENAESFAGICEWAYDFFRSDLPAKADLRPVLAPAYVLARVKLAGSPASEAMKEAVASQFWATLRSGFLRPGDPYAVLYSFGSKGETYPYDIDAIGERIEGWLDPKEQAAALPDLRGRYSRSLNPDRILQSATHPVQGPRHVRGRPASIAEAFVNARIADFSKRAGTR